MNGDEDRRRSARVQREFPLALLDDAGTLLDPQATAHDLSDKGFKIESRTELKSGQYVRFALSLAARDQIKGRAKIDWIKRTDLSFWAGGRFVSMPWPDRRRIRRAANPGEMDWDRVADKAILALSLLLATLVAWNLLMNSVWRGVLAGLVPTAIAAFAMGWALRELLQRRR